jgi:hypothetical protein
MKKIITLLLASVFGCFVLQAQVRSVPAAVTSAFQQKFPGVTDVSWKDHVTNFEAKFKMNGSDYQANFGKRGELKRTERNISYDALPAAVKSSFNSSKYASGWEKGSVSAVDDAKDGFRYRVFVQKNAVQKKFIYFSKEGKLVKEGNI